MNKDVGQNPWIEAGLAEIARHGLAGVRVETLAKALGVSKGGFYWHFKDRRALLSAMLESWSRGRVVAMAKQAEGAGRTAAERLRGLVALYTANANPQGLAIELAMRQWARQDDKAAAAVAQVDATRLRIVERLYKQLGLGADAAATRAFMLYSFVFGQSLMFLRKPKRARIARTSDCAEVLMSVAAGQSRARRR